MATVNTQISKDYSDLDLNFTIHPVKKDINRWVGERAVINSIKNLILTNHYEKPFNPDVGSNVRALLFENLDIITASSLEREITQTIGTYEPRAKILGITVVPDYDNNAFNVSMQFYITNRNETISIQFQLERTR